MALVGTPAKAGKPELAELVGGGWRASREGIAALGIRGEEKCSRWRRDEPRDDLGRRCRNRSSPGEVPRDARRAIRLIVHVVPSLARLCAMRAKSGRRASLGKRNDCRNKKLNQSKQRERRNSRP